MRKKKKRRDYYMKKWVIHFSRKKVLKLQNLVSSINQKNVSIHNSSEDSCKAEQQA